MRKERSALSDETFSVADGGFLIERHIADAMSAAHWHDHVEINLLLEGRMSYLFNGRQERVEAGRLVLFWAAIPHRTVEVTPDAPLVCIYLPLVDFLGLAIDRDVRRSVMQGRFLVAPQPGPMDAIQLPQWVEEWQAGNAARRRLIVDEVRLRVRRLVLDTLDAPDAMAERQSIGHATVQRAELLTELINTHYAEPLSLTHLAKLAGIHPSTANKTFREVLGISVNEYLTRYRLARAMQRLADTDDPILQIAYESGFGSNSRFYDLFKYRTGTTPKLFRSSVSRKAGNGQG